MTVAKKTKGASNSAMDYPAHESSYESFLKLFKWSTISLIVIMILMAIFLL